MSDPTQGRVMYQWASDLYPINRSLTGPGVRDTLAYLQTILPELRVLAVPSGTPAFDWTVPDEWTLHDAYIANEAGERIVDFQRSNLHVVGYSLPVDMWLSRAELDEHLHSLPDQPGAVPYVTSYYAPYWGFCLSHAQRVALPEGQYHAVIQSRLAPGVMNVGELVIPGRDRHEILLSANICHPSLGNNELSGMVVLAALAQRLMAREERRFTYRLVFLPETVGALWYLSENLQHMREHTAAGFVVTCVGDNRTVSYVPSRRGGTHADRVALHVLRHRAPDATKYTYLDRGSDERQYCSPGIDLPVCSIMRSKYGTYPEYHTSLDDLSVISPEGLQGAFDVLAECLDILEANEVFRGTTLGEPQLGRRKLYHDRSEKALYADSRQLLDILAYADGTRDLLALADILGVPALECASRLRILMANGLVELA
jgi:aminopeptidase-like protein